MNDLKTTRDILVILSFGSVWAFLILALTRLIFGPFFVYYT